MTVKLGSLFDGSGGFPLAGALCGIEPVWASEVEPYPIAVTRSRFPNMKHLGDISKVHGGEIEPVDVVTFGSPCQDLSVAGKRAGLKHEANGDEETTRSGLFMEAVRIIKEMRKATNGMYPTFALWENVPGAFSSNGGEDFRIVCEELIKIVEPSAVMPAVPEKGWAYADSYVGDGWSLAYRVFDAQYWGVPQRRRRIHLVLDLRGERAGEILFEREGLRWYFAQSGETRQGTSADAERGFGADDRERKGFDGYNGDLTGDESFTLGVNCGLSSGRNGAIGFMRQLSGVEAQIEKSPTLLAAMGESGNNKPCVAFSFDSLASNSMKSANPHSGCRQVEVSKTLDTTDPNPSKNQGGIAIVQKIEKEQHLFENHSQDTRYKGPLDVSPMLPAQLGTGGNNTPFVVEQTPFCKSARPRFKGDAPTYIPCKVTNTLNTFDVGEARANELVVGAIPIHDQATRFAGKRGEKSDGKGNGLGVGQEGDPMNTLTSGDHHAVAYCTDEGESRANELVVETQPTYCLQGSMIGRTDKNGPQGDGVNEDVSFTCNTTDRHAVAFAMQAIGQYKESNKASSLKARDYKDATDIVCGVDCRNGTEYPELNGTLQAKSGGGTSLNYNQIVRIRYIVRRLTPTECARLQGFADQWGHIEPKEAFTDEEYRFWLEVRNTHAAINGKKVQEYTKPQMLTWYNKLHTDSAEYKMWGNGIALPPALYVMQGIADALYPALVRANLPECCTEKVVD